MHKKSYFCQEEWESMSQSELCQFLHQTSKQIFVWRNTDEGESDKTQTRNFCWRNWEPRRREGGTFIWETQAKRINQSCSKREEVVRPLDEQGFFIWKIRQIGISEEKEGDRTTLTKIFCLKTPHRENLAKHGPDAEDQSKVFLSRRLDPWLSRDCQGS